MNGRDTGYKSQEIAAGEQLSSMINIIPIYLFIYFNYLLALARFQLGTPH